MILKTTDLCKMFLMVCLCCVMTGCSALQNGIREYSSDKVQCYLVNEDVTQFTYKGKSYTILNNTVSNDGLGEWLGYIRQLAAVDEMGTVLVHEAIETASFETLSDLADKAPDARYIIPFLNVYAYYEISRMIVGEEQQGEDRAVYGKGLKKLKKISSRESVKYCKLKNTIEMI